MHLLLPEVCCVIKEDGSSQGGGKYLGITAGQSNANVENQVENSHSDYFLKCFAN